MLDVRYESKLNIQNGSFDEIDAFSQDPYAVFAYLYGPVFFMILANVTFFVLTAVLLRRAGIGSKTGIGSSHRHARERYRLVDCLLSLKQSDVLCVFSS